VSNYDKGSGSFSEAGREVKSYRDLNLSSVWLLIAINIVIFIITLADQSLVYSLGLQPASLLHRPWTMG
jgi:hypothetical protein